MIHKVRLAILQRRNDILLFVGMTAILTTLVLVFASLIHIHKQSIRNEQILKGLSCILLILPENRTQEKVAECVRVNDADDSNFLFKTLSDPDQADVSLSKMGDKTVMLVPIKGDKGDQGEQGVPGEKGADGVSIKGDKGETVVIKGDPGAQGEPGAAGREVEFGVEGGHIVWRYVGDEGWQVLVEFCVITNSCEVKE